MPDGYNRIVAPLLATLTKVLHALGLRIKVTPEPNPHRTYKAPT